MRRALTILMFGAGASAALWLGYGALRSSYLDPRAELKAKIQSMESNVAKYRDAERDKVRLHRQIDQYVNRTLGGNLEIADHRLRTRLNRLAEGLQLANLTVGTATSGKYRESPAKSVFSGIGPQRTLRDEPDFVELEGWITASGSFEQVLRLIDGIEQESWIKRIDQLKIDPADNGSLFDVTVRLTTLFVPGREPDEAGAVAATPSDFGRYAALLAANPFRLPPRAPPPPPPPDPQPMTDRPPTVVAFGYNQWVLTGTAFGPQGSEAWILNAQTRESRRLGAGEGIHDLILVSTNADTAEFRVGQEHFTIRVGQNLGDRTPAGQ